VQLLPNYKWATYAAEFNIKGQKVYRSPVLDPQARDHRPPQNEHGDANASKSFY